MQAPLRVGADLGDYRIDAVVETGGESVVYRATHRSLRRRVALKVVARQLGLEPVVRERFSRESLLLAAIDHPNVVPVYEVGEVEGALLLAMRWVDGERLADLLARDGAIEPARALELVAQVGDALDAVHERGLVHRNVQPANVLIAPDGHVYLSGFGLGRRADSLSGLTGTGLLSTVDYAAPEQIKGERVDRRSDVYSLGCLLYETLTGRPPFDDEGAVGKMWAHVNAPAPSPRALVPALPKALSETVRSALAKGPQDRPQSAAALCRAAHAALAASRPEPALARPSVPPPPELPPDTLEPPAAPPLIEASLPAWRFVPSPQLPQQPDPRRDRRRSRPGGPLAAAAAAASRLARGTEPPSRTVIAALAGLVVAMAALAVLTPGDEPRPSTSQVRVGQPASALAFGRGRLWVASARAGRVRMLDGRKVLRRAAVGGPPLRIAVGRRAIWVLDARAGVVRPLDPRTLEPGRASPVGAGVAGLAAGDGLWVTSAARNELIHLDADGKRKRVAVGAQPVGVAVSGGAAWVANSADGTLSRVRVRDLKASRPIQIGGQPVAVAAAAGSIWVANHGDDTVSRIDPLTGRRVARVRVGARPLDIAGDARGIWVLNASDRTVTRIDPRSLETDAPVPVARDPAALTLSREAIWVASASRSSLTRIPR